MSIVTNAKFQCNMCGECCRNVGKCEVYTELDRGDGVCKYLVGNLCSIYDERPLQCRVDECYEKFFSNKYSREEYYGLNYEACNNLKKRDVCDVFTTA